MNIEIDDETANKLVSKILREDCAVISMLEKTPLGITRQETDFMAAAKIVLKYYESN